MKWFRNLFVNERALALAADRREWLAKREEELREADAESRRRWLMTWVFETQEGR